jgi:drug/metabolite transporter (DMT)-like permease
VLILDFVRQSCHSNFGEQIRFSLITGLLATLVWGLCTVLIKWLLFFVPPFTLLFVQLLASSSFLHFLSRHEKIPRQQIFFFAWPGLLQPGLAFLFGSWGLAHTTASADALIWTSESIVVLPLAWFLLQEQMTFRLVALAMVACLGTILAISPGPVGPAGMSIAGNISVFLGVLCAAIYSIFTRTQLNNNITPLRLLSLHQLSGLILATPFCAFELTCLHHSFSTPGLTVILLALLSGLLQFGAAFWLYFFTLREWGAARAGVLLTLPPILTVIGAYLFLGEHLSSSQIFGAALALLSVTLLTKETNKLESKTPEVKNETPDLSRT